MSAVNGLKGVVRLIDCFERCDSYIIVMEKPEPCKDLFDFITEKGMLEEQVSPISYLKCYCFLDGSAVTSGASLSPSEAILLALCQLARLASALIAWFFRHSFALFHSNSLEGGGKGRESKSFIFSAFPHYFFCCALYLKKVLDGQNARIEFDVAADNTVGALYVHRDGEKIRVEKTK